MNADCAAQLRARLPEGLRVLQPFSIEFDGLGAFASQERARLLFAELRHLFFPKLGFACGILALVQSHLEPGAVR